VRLLLDVHHSRHAARRLRDDGHDVIAASDDAVMAAVEDEELLRLATSDRRVLVTENAKDFDPIVRTWAAAGEHHAGVVFTSPRRLHRGSTSYPDSLVKALGDLLADAPADMTDRIHWL
jgi:uncharacterized protein YbjT (DUF2867 family)